jgi:acyl-CoA synthetase (AMP-forming)/AMP-acid ligase II
MGLSSVLDRAPGQALVSAPIMDPRWQNLSDPIFTHAQTRPDAPALVDGPDGLTYRALAELVAKASVYLRDLDIGQGDRVGLALGNSIDHIILLFALLRVGAVPAELSPDDSGEAIATMVQRYGMRAVFTEPAKDLPAGITRHRLMTDFRATIAGKSGDARCAADGDALELLNLTTGSTGTPSGVIWTHRKFLRRCEVRLGTYYPHGLGGQPPRDMLLTASMRYAWFFLVTVMQIFAGGRLVILPNFAKPIEMVRTIASWKGAICCATANMCRLFLIAAPESGRLFPDLYALEASGLPLFPWEKEAMIARVVENFREGYGTAGIGAISVLLSQDMLRKPGSVGLPLPLLEVQIVDENSQPLTAGSYGAIRCRSPLLSRPCPENGTAPRAEYFRGEWYYPGDIGMLDADGYLYLRGRVADIIRRGGHEVFAPDIEEAMARHPLIAEVAVVGIPSPTVGEEVIAFVVKGGAIEHEDVARHCQTMLAPAQRPDRIFYVAMLPRLGAGKTDRARLQSLALSEAVRRGG